MCEVGDYAGVRRLVEEEKVDVNVKDTEYKVLFFVGRSEILWLL